MIIKDKIKEIAGGHQELIGKFIELNQIGSFFNFMEEAIDEFDDKDLINKFSELQELIRKKREKIANTEIKEDKHTTEK